MFANKKIDAHHFDEEISSSSNRKSEMLMRWSMMNQLMKSTLVLSSGHRALSSHADVFRQILNERKSTKAFDTTPIPQEILTDLMESTRVC